jgi:hypothetical protein
MHRRRLLLLSLITIVLAVLTAVVLMVQQGTGASTSRVEKPYPTPALSARQAYGRLATWADGWAEDAKLVTASLSLVKAEERNAPWSFLVYSRAQKRIAVVILAGSELTVLREQPAVYPQTGIDPERWTLDSDAVLERWWHRGGNEAWSRSEARSLHLRLGTEADAVVWRVTVLDSSGEPIGFWGIQADTGASLPEYESGRE